MLQRLRQFTALLGMGLALCLASGCRQEALPANPALWQVDGPKGERGWLFGTIHSATQPLDWKTAPVARALDQADEIVVEVGNIADDAKVSATFAALARSKGEPALSQRITPGLRPALTTLLEQAGYSDDSFGSMDTWAAALTLARNSGENGDPANGVDRAVIALAGSRPVVELEGATRQLEIFDGLPESEQRDLLAAVVREASQPQRDLAASWRKGDMDAIASETREGMLADPELRATLFTGRNTRWASRIAGLLAGGHKPFVAVGAAHMAGPDGLPALLRAKGYEVTRIE